MAGYFGSNGPVHFITFLSRKQARGKIEQRDYLVQANVDWDPILTVLWVKLASLAPSLIKCGLMVKLKPISSLFLLGRSRLKPWLGPGYFLLQSSDCMLETCMLLAEGRRVLVIPIKAIGVGVGVYRKISLFLICLWLNNIASQYSSVFVVVFLSVMNIRHH